MFDGDSMGKWLSGGSIKEGVNLKDIDAGIIVQLSNTDRYFTQVLGRTLRSSNPEQYIIYIKNTRDEEYLTKAISKVDTGLIQTLNINEL